MSVDRLLGVAFPITSLTWRSTKKATLICTLVWLLAFAGTVPLLSIQQTFNIEDVGVTCHDVLHPLSCMIPVLHPILLYFFLPLVVTVVSYSCASYMCSPPKKGSLGENDILRQAKESCDYDRSCADGVCGVLCTNKRHLVVPLCSFSHRRQQVVCIVQPCNGTDWECSEFQQDHQTPPPRTHTTFSDESDDFLKGLLVTHIMPSFYIIIILISLPLNAMALVTFTCKIREKKPAVIYMSHLACVDLLFTLLLPLKIHYQMNGSDWVFGE
ncbi:hypothetical protein QQF64_026127 [Cirrhinus molitorella]|uniref:G-protein coupled receptors family 1 profile domain-containing protein n=1 Tax=Cirrhinus molitorella TaxID=172907 RepID=A0ABR3NIN3_9TELE